MLTISKPLSAAQTYRYHADEFVNARDNYYTSGDAIRGSWHGRLAAYWGLQCEVGDELFQRLAEGQHPITGEPLVRQQTARHSTNARGDAVIPMAHRAGWDLTFSAPKSVSLTALVGGDGRVREVHRASVVVALDETEPYVQARLGNSRPAQTTGQWIAARFEHDSARPVNGYAAPQLHTHVVVFNLTQTETGDIRPLQPRELYRTQHYATAVYRSELASRLTALGYEIERGPNGQPEIRGYTLGYLDASSPRRQQIDAHLAMAKQSGATAAEIAAHRTREAKLAITHDEMQRRHRALAEAFGDQPARVVETAHTRGFHLEPSPPRTTAHAAVTFARDRNFEREAVVDERALLRDGLARAMGELTVREIKVDVEHRVEVGEFVPARQPPGSPSRAARNDRARARDPATDARGPARALAVGDTGHCPPGRVRLPTAEHGPAGRRSADPRQPRSDPGA